MTHPDYEKYAAEVAASKAATEAMQLATELGVQPPDYVNTDSPVEAQPVQPRMIHRTGNLLDFAEAGMFDVVVQGCNCFNAMGGGIAYEILSRYPEVAEVDRETRYADYNKLGNWTSWPVPCKSGDAHFTVINAYTQYEMSNGKDVFEYAAFELILKKLAYKYPKKRIGFPYIGMGLAQGNKHRIMMMLHDFARTIYTSGGSVTLVRFG